MLIHVTKTVTRWYSLSLTTFKKQWLNWTRTQIIFGECLAKLVTFTLQIQCTIIFTPGRPHESIRGNTNNIILVIKALGLGFSNKTESNNPKTTSVVEKDNYKLFCISYIKKSETDSHLSKTANIFVVLI